MPTIAVFADVQNIYYTCRQGFGRQFNYRSCWQQLSELGEIVQAEAYAIDRADQQQLKFQSALKHIGFNVKLKPFIQRSDGTAKGDWDVGITIDIMEAAAANVDIVVLLSGDGDFAMLLEHIKQKHSLQTLVYGVEALSALSLVRSCDKFIKIEQNLLL